MNRTDHVSGKQTDAFVATETHYPAALKPDKSGLSLPPTGNLPVDKCLLLMWEVNSGLKSEDKAIEETRDEYKRKESQLERRQCKKSKLMSLKHKKSEQGNSFC
ncbi:uncharacterized protein LOC134188491 [Corticium candelabrum]|uniref:uncharacterized protein LOC134188491 n=1 Tax=Corticium candelabrum TaxID=121492 RepID=UPI002E2744A0|nr:uncharacterized protein LOC134188491 [Corticium candelabrum]